MSDKATNLQHLTYHYVNRVLRVCPRCSRFLRWHLIEQPEVVKAEVQQEDWDRQMHHCENALKTLRR